MVIKLVGAGIEQQVTWFMYSVVLFLLGFQLYYSSMVWSRAFPLGTPVQLASCMCFKMSIKEKPHSQITAV